LFGLPVEPAQLHKRKRSDGFKAASGKLLLFGEAFKNVSNVIACIENQSKCLWLLGELFMSHIALMSDAILLPCGYMKPIAFKIQEYVVF
jgi:hypothetical protein